MGSRIWTRMGGFVQTPGLQPARSMNPIALDCPACDAEMVVEMVAVAPVSIS